MLLVPLPFFLAQSGAVPPARMLMLAAVALAVIAAEGAGGMVGPSALLLAGQALGYGLALWLAAGLAARGLARLPRRAAAAVTLGLLLVAVTVAWRHELYRDPFRAHGLRTSLAHLYE